MSKEANIKKLLEIEIRTILLKDWDPIGIKDIPEAQDEYDSYISSIYELINSKKPESEFFEYLWWIETENMGLSGNRKHTKDIAHKLFKLSNPP